MVELMSSTKWSTILRMSLCISAHMRLQLDVINWIWEWIFPARGLIGSTSVEFGKFLMFCCFIGLMFQSFLLLSQLLGYPNHSGIFVGCGILCQWGGMFS